MKNPVMIEGIDDTRSYDERSLNQWVERCIRENFVNSEGLVLCPHKSDVYFDPKKIRLNGNLQGSIQDAVRIFKTWTESDAFSTRFPLEVTQELKLEETDMSVIYNAILNNKLGPKNQFRGITSNIFNDFDKITNLDLLKTEGLKPPQIIVIGNENNGKSSLLERLIGYSIFPTRTHSGELGACTICAVRVKLRRSTNDTAEIAKVWVRNRVNTDDIRDLKIVPILNLSAVVSDLMNKMRRDAPQLETAALYRVALNTVDEIVIEISTPNCPNLDILDLPGLSNADEKAEGESDSYVLADQILAAEKKHSLILMVVKADGFGSTIAYSRAPKLIKLHDLKQQTTGVLTFIDQIGLSYDPDDPHSRSPDTLLMQALNPKDKKDNYFEGITWMACSNNKPRDNADLHISVRIGKTDEKEENLIRTKFPSFIDRDTGRAKDIGLPAIRSVTEANFEKYIVTNWSRAIQGHLITYFYELSDKNIKVGLPMLNAPQYHDPCEQIKHLCKDHKILPDFDCTSMFQLYDDSEVKKIIVERSSHVCESGDWLKFEECKQLYGALELLKKLKPPENLIDFDKSFSEIKRMEKYVVDQLEAIKREILSLGTKVAERFVSAALKEKESAVVAQKGFLTSVKGFLNIFSFSPEKQTKLLRFEERFPGLLKDYSEFMARKVDTINETFEKYANQKIADMRGHLLFQEQSLSNEGGVSKSKVKLSWTNVYHHHGPSYIGHEFTNYWLDLLMRQIPTITREYPVKAEFLKTETFMEERVKLLVEMVNVAKALKAIKDLQVKYNPRLILYNSIDNFTSSYSSSFCEDIVLSKKGGWTHGNIAAAGALSGNNSVRGICLCVDRSNLFGTKDPLLITSNDSNNIVIYNAENKKNYRTISESCDAINDKVVLKFQSPQNLCIGPSTSDRKQTPLLYVSESGSHQVRVMFLDCLIGIASHEAKSPILHHLIIGKAGSKDGELNGPSGICLGPSVNLDSVEPLLYVCDSNNNRISVFNAVSGLFIRTIGVNQLKNPTQLCIAKKNTKNEMLLFVSDSGNARIAIFNTVTGEYKGQIAESAGFSNPGGLFCSSEYNGAASSAGPSASVGGGGGGGGAAPSSGAAADDVLNLGSKLSDPYLYVADQGNNKIQVFKVAPDGSAKVIATNPPMAALTSSPRKLIGARSNDGESFLYVACADNIKLVTKPQWA